MRIINYVSGHKPRTFSILPLEIPPTFNDFKDGKSFVSYFEKSGMVLDGRSELRDTTKEIISLNAYKKYLAEEITKNVVQQLPF